VHHFLKTVILVPFLLSFASWAPAALLSEKIPYYGKEFYQDLQSNVPGKDLSMRLKLVLRSYHSAVGGDLDEVSSSCKQRCYQHTAIGYKAARVFLLSNYYLIKTADGYNVHDVYCDHDITPADFKWGKPAGPDRLPDERVVNVEHTWPQSRFTGRYPTELQKSDLHHLYPTNSKTNSARGNNKFGEVARETQHLDCPNVHAGVAAGGHSQIFEPPKEHKGNVARALFYFSTRYDLAIDPEEEAFLRKWHREDPVDEEEMARNEKIFTAQRDRNPFVDYPELVDKIENF
jgi:deoxyribonuclease-1